jgi:hypothetical protein
LTPTELHASFKGRRRPSPVRTLISSRSNSARPPWTVSNKRPCAAADTDDLTKHDIASEATWADRYRDSNGRRDHYDDTKRWHFVDLEIDDPDITKACYGRRPLSPDTPASIGDKLACVVDKVAQFAAELEAPGTDAEERLFALKFILHFVGHAPTVARVRQQRCRRQQRKGHG